MFYKSKLAITFNIDNKKAAFDMIDFPNSFFLIVLVL